MTIDPTLPEPIDAAGLRQKVQVLIGALSEEVVRLREENERLEKLVYVPGVWACPKCKFQLIQSNLNASDGSVTARDTPGEKCPNCATPLWRTSYRDEYKHWAEGYEALLIERTLPTETRLHALFEAAAMALAALGPFVVCAGRSPASARETHQPKFSWRYAPTVGDFRAAASAAKALAAVMEEKT